MTRAHTTSLFHVLFLSLSMLLLQILLSVTAYAEEGSTVGATVQAEVRPARPLPSVRQNVMDTYRDKQEALQRELRDKRAATEAEIREKRASVEAEVKEKRAQLASTSAAVRGTMKENREERREAIASSSEARKATMEARVEARREEMKAKEETRKEELRSKLAEKGKAQFETVIKRLLAAMERLGDISSRIDTRISKLKAENIDMTSVEALNVTAKAAIAVADADVRAIPAPVFPALGDASTTPALINEALSASREGAKKAQTSIAAAQKALGAVVAEIKKKGGAKAEAEAGETKTE